MVQQLHRNGHFYETKGQSMQENRRKNWLTAGWEVHARRCARVREAEFGSGHGGGRRVSEGDGGSPPQDEAARVILGNVLGNFGVGGRVQGGVKVVAGWTVR